VRITIPYTVTHIQAAAFQGCHILRFIQLSTNLVYIGWRAFDDASMVAEAMVGLGADVVFLNVDYAAYRYGGDITELISAAKAVRRVSKTAAVVMKDIILDEIQLGLAKDAGADGVVLIASVLGLPFPIF